MMMTQQIPAQCEFVASIQRVVHKFEGDARRCQCGEVAVDLPVFRRKTRQYRRPPVPIPEGK